MSNMIFFEGKNIQQNNKELNIKSESTRSKKIIVLGSFLVAFTSTCLSPININTTHEEKYVMSFKQQDNNYLKIDAHINSHNSYNLIDSISEDKKNVKMNVYNLKSKNESIELNRFKRQEFNYIEDTVEFDDYIDFKPRKKECINLKVDNGVRRTFNYDMEA